MTIKSESSNPSKYDAEIGGDKAIKTLIQHCVICFFENQVESSHPNPSLSVPAKVPYCRGHSSVSTAWRFAGRSEPTLARKGRGYNILG